MSNPSNQTPTSFSFGQPAANNPTTAQSSNLFSMGASTGNTNSSESAVGQSSLFGAANTSGGFGATSQGGSSTLFGTAKNIGGAFSFGNQQDNNKQDSPSPFAGFGTPNKPTTSSSGAQNQASSLFGNNTSTAATAATGSTTPATTKSGFSFGNVSTTPAGPPPAAPTGNLFNFPSSQSNSGTSLFGGLAGNKSSEQQQTSQTSTAASNIFGKTQNTTSSVSQGQSSASPLFSNAGSSSGPSLFGNLSKPDAIKSTEVSQPPANASISNEPFKQSMQFPSSSSTSQAVTQPVTTSSTGTPFSFTTSSANAASQPTSTAGITSSSGEASKPSLFGSTQQPASSSSNPFANVNQKKDAQTTETTSQPSTASTSAAAPAPTPSTTSSLFNLGKPADSAPSSQAPTATGTVSSTNGTNSAPTAAGLSSSTSGPTPGTQSRLKNKSMDEIITRWASDLSKYQKEFQSQAEKVASWDRMLVDNSGKISKLYSKTFQAERDMAEVERQLTSVEGQQNELSIYLDRYEREVDEMMTRQIGQGEGLQGPDQERERTYKSAERVSERLNEMGKDLTSMIEEINAASAAISKSSKPDDPLSQIVRVLNGHLSQLQIIDQESVDLKAKIVAAQKESQRLSSSRQTGMGNDGTDDFYRSYTSRR